MPKPKPQAAHPTLARTRKPQPPVGTPEHQEWLVDEADEESFPASDASSSASPGSTAQVNEKKRKTKK